MRVIQICRRVLALKKGAHLHLLQNVLSVIIFFAKIRNILKKKTWIWYKELDIFCSSFISIQIRSQATSGAQSSPFITNFSIFIKNWQVQLKNFWNGFVFKQIYYRNIQFKLCMCMYTCVYAYMYVSV